MQISVLASGSKGNCTLIRDDDTAVLIDAGISARRIQQKLSELHLDIRDISSILITHEHIDHIRGLKTLSKNYQIPLYAKLNTFKAMPFIRDIPTECCRALPDSSFTVGSLTVNSFTVPHDAAEPVGYNIQTKQGKITLATDLGFATDAVQQALDGSDILVLEANHDINLLQNGAYPWHLKKRILGTRGHLSNEAAGFTLKNLPHKPQEVILAHLSEHNNTPQTAVNTIRSIISQHENAAVNLHVASPDKTLSLNFN